MTMMMIHTHTPTHPHTYAGLELTQEDIDLLNPALQTPATGIPLLNVIGNIIAYRAGIAWTTLGHTGTIQRQLSPGSLASLNWPRSLNPLLS
jgi:hypothetical protein